MRPIALFLLTVSCSFAQVPFPSAFWRTPPATGFSFLASDSVVSRYDASDSTSITKSSQRVSQWSDLSGNSKHMTDAATGSQPYLTYNSQNGLPGIYFDGTRPDSLTCSFVSIIYQRLTVFVVVKMDASTAAYGRVIGIGNLAHDPDFASDQNACVILRDGATDGFTAYRNLPLSTTAVTTGAANVIVSKFDGTNHTMYRDGTGSSPVASAGTFNSTVLRTGATVNYVGGGSTVTIYEVVVCRTAIGDTRRAEIESHLKTKWGTP